MSTSVQTPQELIALGLAQPGERAALEAVAERYAVAISPTILGLIDKADPADPIARQFVPSPAEMVTTADERADPIGDHAHSPVEGVVHRYPDRVLLKLVNVCAVYCRFCFRREMVGQGGPAMLSPAQFDTAFNYIAARPEIWEVILTGGDPLVMSPRRLRTVMARLGTIPHVKIVRIHTRVPTVEPERVTPALVEALKDSGKTTYLGLHVNHARELSAAARAACARIVEAGIPMVSQTVLLKGVNDRADVLADLMRALIECRVKPYYLHHGDLAPGTSHLRTDIATGQALMRQLQGRLSGLALPSYVLDIPGGYGKAPAGPAYVTANGEAGQVTVTDFNGRAHIYPPRGSGV
ncbi:MAG: lysine-2,3-aminomutase-like protein [Xanthobacteraceae bacterium]|uniref:lysine-2,3-aminomutase-like protein n=1 Tax=Pseudolabrys sp. TaxID=1960880 RepID=UPI003D09BCB1